jgi:hypothetical protein
VGERDSEPVESLGSLCPDCYTEATESHKYDSPLAFAAYAAVMDGASSEQMSDGYGEWADMIVTVIVSGDSQGFVYAWDYGTPERAQKEWDDLYSSGLGAEDDDAYIGYDRGAYHVAFEGKYVAAYETRRRALAKVSLLMRESGFYPSVWEERERGGIDEITSEVW